VRRRIIAMLTAAFLIIPGFSVAQRHGGGEGQQNLKSSTMKASMGMMQGNMALMAEITDKMQQMMREMAVPHGEEVKKRHNHELQKMRNELDSF
jgi:hypothetical protein